MPGLKIDAWERANATIRCISTPPWHANPSFTPHSARIVGAGLGERDARRARTLLLAVVASPSLRTFSLPAV